MGECSMVAWGSRWGECKLGARDWGLASVWVVRPVPALTGPPPPRYKMGTLIPTLPSFQKGHREGEEEVVSCTPWQVSSHWKDTPKVLPPSSGQDPELVGGSRDEVPWDTGRFTTT